MKTLAAWSAVMDCLQAEIRRANNGYASRGLPASCDDTVSEDDEAMCDASDDDLFAWCDDLEARVGYDTDAMRAAVAEYVALR